MSSDTLHPSTMLLSKVASILVHADELHGPGGHTVDLTALTIALKDPEIQTWIKEMTAMALAPVKRN